MGATEYTDAIEAANLCADYLKKIAHCDLVVVVSHIGYDDQKFGSDVDMARASRNIDVTIGAHRHRAGDSDRPLRRQHRRDHH